MRKFRRDVCPKCDAHEGFFSMWNSFKDETLNHVKYLNGKYSDSKIIVTGHSLGAALATLAGYDLRREYG